MSYGEHAEKGSNSWARSLLSIAAMIIMVAVIAIALRMFVFVPYEIPSGSMETTIMTGDMVFSEKISYYSRAPQSGDIVTFSDPQYPDRTLIKRVIAVEGQTVDLIDGTVHVDGYPLDEPYTNGKRSNPEMHPTNPSADIVYPYKVPEGHVWVMGDSRTNSQDSRYFGAIPVSSVSGRAIVIYWPVEHIGILS